MWCEKSGLEHKLGGDAATAPEGMEGMMMEGEGDGAMNDGGDGEMMMMEGEAAGAAAPKKETPEASAFGDMAGPAEIPKILVCMTVCYPAFADAVKAQVIDYEFGGSGTSDLSHIVAILSMYVDAQEKAEAESWGCAWVTDDELEELKAVEKDKEKQALVFPGTVVAWPSQEVAVGNAGEVSGKKKVVFKFANKVHKVADDKCHVIYRPMAKVTSLKEADGVTTVELADFAAAAFATIKEHGDKVKALLEAGAAGAAAAKDAVMGDGMMMMEGDMMMGDPPMEG